MYLRKSSRRSLLAQVALLLPLVLWTAMPRAEDPVADLPPPHRLVESVTTQVLDDIAHYRNGGDGSLSDDEKKARERAFFDELAATLSPVIDFDHIAVLVMGQYRNAATEDQLERFKKVFKEGLVETYGRGLLSYGNQKIIIFPPDEDISGQSKVSVTQEIQGVDANYPLVYSMGFNRRTDEWKVINVIINGINLGSTFRNQFAQSAQKFKGDLDLVIDQWAF